MISKDTILVGLKSFALWLCLRIILLASFVVFLIAVAPLLIVQTIRSLLHTETET